MEGCEQRTEGRAIKAQKISEFSHWHWKAGAQARHQRLTI